MKLAIWGNTQKPEFWDLFPKLISWLDKKNQEVYISTDLCKHLKDDSSFTYSIIKNQSDFRKVDFVLSMGGDGTILSAARAVGNIGTPIFGVHLGGLGFLAEGNVEDIFVSLNSIINKQYSIYPRILVQAKIEGEKNFKVSALNDIVIDTGEGLHLINCSLYSGKNLITSYSADGLIISTPTGSTAYNLSAGGPIVAPWLSLLTVTPICPHTLSSRPIVLPTDKKYRITFPVNESGARLSVDGQLEYNLNYGDIIFIRKADYCVNMISFEDKDYFQILRSKMGWGQNKNLEFKDRAT
ncbi:MAG: NAD(+) kinase [Candidatus Marinimicrobia bacterium]|nr:NAD(+) kinase [Candidatus Neomarinimicrobiota bacterium]|tara:strand:- start:5705 stop:6595 length:891 start_codon:yes stop_codon:yes gene_type:complete